MPTLRSLTLAAILLAAACPLLTGSVAAAAGSDGPDVSIATWPGDRPAAVTFTFDDGYPAHLTTVVPIFKEFGYRCTFYIIPYRVGPPLKQTAWADWKAAAEDGFEIGNHTFRHSLSMKDPEQALTDIDQGYDAIEEHTGIAPLTFAFPGGTQKPLTLQVFPKSKHIAYRREIQLDLNMKKVKTEWTRKWFGPKRTNAKDFPSVMEPAIAHKPIWTGAKISWMVGLIHKIPEETANGLRETLAYIKENDDKIWCATYAQAEIYDAEREKSKLAVTERKPTSVTFTVTNELDKTIYTQPLTIRIQPPSSPAKPSAKRGGKPLPASVKDGVVLVDVVPGPKPVTVSW